MRPYGETKSLERVHPPSRVGVHAFRIRGTRKRHRKPHKAKARRWWAHDQSCYERTLKAQIARWIARHPGRDAEHVSLAFGISSTLAMDLTEELLAQGILGFAD